MCTLFSVEEDIWSKFSVAALPADEKEKLYKAIDYNENVRMKYPTEVRKIILMNFLISYRTCKGSNTRLTSSRI